MGKFIIFLAIGLFGVWLGRYLAIQKKMKQREESSKKGVVNVRQAEKEKNLKKLKDSLKSRETVTNDEVQKITGVSHATATRYLDKLEEEGLVEQVGRKGRSVHYRVKKNE